MSITFYNNSNYYGDDAKKWAKDDITEQHNTCFCPANIFERYIEPKYSNIEYSEIEDELITLCNKLEAKTLIIKDDKINDWLWHQAEIDFEEAQYHLHNALDVFNKNNPSATNHLLLKGKIERWNDTNSGIDPVSTFNDIFSSRKSHFKDCEISKMIINGKDLELEGYHHDGGVYINARQLTNEGERWFDEIDYMGYLPEEPITIDDKQFKEGEELQFLNYLFENYTENLEDILV